MRTRIVRTRTRTGRTRLQHWWECWIQSNQLIPYNRNWSNLQLVVLLTSWKQFKPVGTQKPVSSVLENGWEFNRNQLSTNQPTNQHTNQIPTYQHSTYKIINAHKNKNTKQTEKKHPPKIPTPPKIKTTRWNLMHSIMLNCVFFLFLVHFRYRRYPDYHKYLGEVFRHKADVQDMDISPYDECILFMMSFCNEA